jgi:hypothetical protein
VSGTRVRIRLAAKSPPTSACGGTACRLGQEDWTAPRVRSGGPETSKPPEGGSRSVPREGLNKRLAR